MGVTYRFIKKDQTPDINTVDVQSGDMFSRLMHYKPSFLVFFLGSWNCFLSEAQQWRKMRNL